MTLCRNSFKFKWCSA